ncbi:GntR family transcriptional regulator [Streptomyces capoamus]|uniref:GntR family transcriptional regulator n=1 Tax=Streptomyces capoamus TaxID=68183 RepID=A0A919EWQ5_9ACTN|nr:PLP-dependent aminotransferase family protein [Streptomyces capoamus]GGW19739.1 GntR family transcriptional regulator [Streptomyces libani subsp. rufus]GHG45678.1 GntR family transcriptional regulator [Streptomyces capoamus]
MPVQWTGLTPELLLTVDRGSGEQLRLQLERQLRDAIRGGRLHAGERLPSSRELARQLGLSRGLVQDCYAQLQAEGYLVTRVGSATRVAPCAPAAPAAPPAAPAPEPPRLIADFRHGVPDLASFPRADWLWAVREAARRMPTADLGYGDPRGSHGLRTVVAAYLRRIRAAAADPDHTLVCSGYAQGLALVLQALAGGGVRAVALEDPGSPTTAAAAVRAAGLTPVAVPVDEHGIDVAALEASGARAVIVTPAHQWPTGVLLAPERRHALLGWARRHDAYVIEDDYDAEFRYDREPVGALQGLAADRVVSIGTVSKSLAPALRIGWLLSPPALTARLSELKRIADRGTPTLDQLALARLIESGRYDRHLRRMRGLYGARCTVLRAALAEHAPEVRLSGLAAGFHAVAHLPSGADEQEVVDAARARRVGLYGMGAFRTARTAAPPRLVLGFGDVTERAIAEGIAAVGPVLTGSA